MAKCDKNTSSGEKTVPISKDAAWNNAMEIMEKLLSNENKLGLKDFQAAAIVGNMYEESGWNPTSYIKSDGGQGQSGGLCHWHDKVNGNGRFTNLNNYAKECSKQWQDLNLQINFLIEKELKDTQNVPFNSLKNTRDITNATITFCKEFERPDTIKYPNACTKRVTWAKQVLERWNKRS